MKFLAQRLVLIFLFCFPGFCHASEDGPDSYLHFCNWRNEEGKCNLYSISIINLIATPERFHRERVRLKAYVYADTEQTLLYLLPKTSYSESIRLSLLKEPKEWNDATADEYDKRNKEISKKFHGKSVIIEGTFSMTSGGLASGVLYDITRMDIWSFPF